MSKFSASRVGVLPIPLVGKTLKFDNMLLVKFVQSEQQRSDRSTSLKSLGIAVNDQFRI